MILQTLVLEMDTFVHNINQDISNALFNEVSIKSEIYHDAFILLILTNSHY